MSRAARAGLIAAAAVLLAAALVLLGPFGRPYRRRNADTDSDDVRQALDAVRALSAGGEVGASAVSADATARARQALKAEAERLKGAGDLTVREAAWYGAYLRLTVECAMPDGRAVTRSFLLRREQGRMRLTGVET